MTVVYFLFQGAPPISPLLDYQIEIQQKQEVRLKEEEEEKRLELSSTNKIIEKELLQAKGLLEHRSRNTFY